MIRFFTTSFPRHADDPAGHFVAALASGLVAAGRTVSVEAAVSKWAPPGVAIDAWAGRSARLFTQAGAPESFDSGGLVALAAGAEAGVRVLARGVALRGRQRICVGHWLVPCGPAALAAGGRTVLYAHGSDVALLESLPGGRMLARTLDARAAHLNFVSVDLRARFEALLGRSPRAPSTTLPMGVDEPAPDPAALAPHLDHLPPLPRASLRIVTVSRLVPLKGLDVLADALAGLEGALWVAAGEGPELRRLRERCAARGVAFHAVGPLGPGARDALLRQADVFVLPSRAVGTRREGTPLALLEAQLAGLPCVASRLGGVPAAASPGGVRLVPPNDPAALRAALEAFVTEPGAAARRAAAGRASADFARRFTWRSLMPAHVSAIVGDP